MSRPPRSPETWEQRIEHRLTRLEVVAGLVLLGTAGQYRHEIGQGFQVAAALLGIA